MFEVWTFYCVFDSVVKKIDFELIDYVCVWWIQVKKSNLVKKKVK